MKRGTFYISTTVLAGVVEFLILLYMLLFFKASRGSVHRVGWWSITVACLLSVIKRTIYLTTGSLVLLRFVNFLIYPAAVVFMASFVKSYASYFEIKMMSFSKQQVLVPRILKGKFFNPLFYGSIFVVSFLSLFMGILFLLSFIDSDKYSRPDYGASLAVLFPLILLWIIVAIFVLNSFAKALTFHLKDPGIAEKVAAILASTKSIKSSMIAIFFLFVCVLIVSNISLIWWLYDALAKALTVLFLFLTAKPFITALKTEIKFKESHTHESDYSIDL